mmetsp:Transcript_26248/g.46923  ORF Transcript_26248/g.46923 Transcript_26248/m.46923 type:complete len:382 (+) Transcript_26248:4184-5329(+)
MELLDLFDTPSHLKCPISRRLMKSPVRAPDGITYDKKHLCSWLLTQTRSPITSISFPVDFIGRVELKYSEAVHAEIVKYCAEKVELLAKSSLEAQPGQTLDRTVDRLCELLEYLKPSLYRDLYRALLNSLSTQRRAAFSFFAAYSKSRSLNKLKVLRSLTTDPKTSSFFSEFLAVTHNEHGDFESALRELNSLKVIESLELQELQIELVLRLWGKLEDLTQYSRKTLEGLLKKAKEKGLKKIVVEVAFYLFYKAYCFADAWEFLALLLEYREYRPEVKDYMMAHIEELLKLEEDCPADLLSFLLLQERKYELLAVYYHKLNPVQFLADYADPIEIDYIMKLPGFPSDSTNDMKAAKGKALLRLGKNEEGYEEFSEIADSCI